MQKKDLDAMRRMQDAMTYGEARAMVTSKPHHKKALNKLNEGMNALLTEFVLHANQCEDGGEKQVLITVLAEYLYQQAGNGLLSMFLAAPTALLKDATFATVYVMTLNGLGASAASTSELFTNLPKELQQRAEMLEEAARSAALKKVAEKAFSAAKKFRSDASLDS